jgi:hypothetical protein
MRMFMGGADHSDLRIAFSLFSTEQSQPFGSGLFDSLIFLALSLPLRLK